MTEASFEFGWRERQAPLAPMAAAARGGAIARFASRLLELAPEVLASLHAVAGPRVLLVLDPDARGLSCGVPWCDGLEWLGRDPAVRGLLAPTAETTTLPMALVAEGLQRRGHSLPLGLLPPERSVDLGRTALIPLGAARQIDPRRLRAHRDGLRVHATA